jgi:hypothetical protein
MYPPEVSTDTLRQTHQDKKAGEYSNLREIHLIRKNIYCLFNNERRKDINDIYGNQRQSADNEIPLILLDKNPVDNTFFPKLS